MSRNTLRIAAASTAYFFLCSVAPAQDPLDVLCTLYPSVQSHIAGHDFRYLLGSDMTAASTEGQAAALFLAVHGASLRTSSQGSAPDLYQFRTTRTLDDKYEIFTYRQRIRGKEVDGSDVRVKVRRGPVARVDFAAAKLAGEPLLGSETPAVPADAASLLVQVQPDYPELTVEGPPQLVVLRGDNARPDAWCWRVRTREGQGILAKYRLHYVDTTSLRVLLTIDQFWNCAPPTTGVVAARGTPAAYPYLPYRGSSASLVTNPIPGARVDGIAAPVDADFTFTNSGGVYSLNFGSPGQSISVATSLSLPGNWYRMYVIPGTMPIEYLSAAGQTTGGGALHFILHNAAMSEEFRVAQADIVVSANRARNFFRQYISTSAANLSYPVFFVPNHIGAIAPCNAAVFPVPPSPPFYYSIVSAPSSATWTPPCWNWASHSIICHEYGHIALDMLGMQATKTNLAFHEGYADTFANMVNDDAVQGRQQFQDNTNVRDDPTSTWINCQYPLAVPRSSTAACQCGISHLAGQLLSGPWVRIRESYKTRYGAKAGLAYARDLFAQWSLITMGGDDGCGSAHPGTLAEVLSAASGVPDDGIISDAFAQHNIRLDSTPPPVP